MFRRYPTYRCVCVQVSTHVLNFQLQLLLRPVASTLDLSSISYSIPCRPIEANLEGKMFQEVSCAIRLIRLCPRSSINPHTHSRSLSPWRMLCSNLDIVSRFPMPPVESPYSQSIRQCRRLSFHAILHNRSRKSPLQGRGLGESSAAAQSLCEVES
jgi:hypothetical protein